MKYPSYRVPYGSSYSRYHSQSDSRTAEVPGALILGSFFGYIKSSLLAVGISFLYTFLRDSLRFDDDLLCLSLIHI